MTSIKQEAEQYTGNQIANIADLPKVSTSVELEERTYKKGTPEEYKQKVIVVEGEDYRVPPIVLGQLKDQLEENPSLEFFKVKKTGQGREGTKYTVIPILS